MVRAMNMNSGESIESGLVCRGRRLDGIDDVEGDRARPYPIAIGDRGEAGKAAAGFGNEGQGIAGDHDRGEGWLLRLAVAWEG